MENILTTILKDTYTLRDIKHKLNVLKTYLEQEFFSAQSKGLLSSGLEAQDLAWLKSLSPAFLQNFSKDNVNNLFSDLQKRIDALKVLTIYLTFEPDKDTLSQIAGKVRLTFPNLFLLDVKYDPSLIAGPALVYKGIYKDYSLRAQIGSKKEQILQSFKKFLR